ncbi:cupin-like domain-containing protein [Trinickia sp. NRRL B-1857]|uniref:cupin-like domain-containing protein n=1 Tax=Trinickia sp. NRRL B-1857 TaxID=3162879 RepID=UPI003D2CA8E9
MIARVSSSEFSSRFFEQGQPAIITDALADWQLDTRWTPDALARMATDRRIVSSRADDGRYRFAPSDEGAQSNVFENSEVEFGEAARRLLDPDDGDTVYVMQQSIPEKLPELLEHVVVPPWITGQHPAINLWFGRRTATQLHFDHSNNFFAQLYGTKEFTLFAPADSEHLYPYHHDSATSHLSYVDLDDPELDKHPRFARAVADRFTMQPGDLLFLPAFWWHHVRAPGVAVSVNFWWAPRWTQIVASDNSMRALSNLYAVDRLKTFREAFLSPEGLDLISGGDRLVASGRTWGACVLALAALDEWIGEQALRSDAGGPAGCRLKALSAELRQCAEDASVHDSGAPGLKPVLHEAAQLADIVAARYGDEALEAHRVDALLRAIERELASVHRPSNAVAASADGVAS